MTTDNNNLPIIKRAAVKCDDVGPTSPVDPKAAPLIAHATPPKATIAIRARTGGPVNHFPQHPLPDRSDGDLQIRDNWVIIYECRFFCEIVSIH